MNNLEEYLRIITNENVGVVFGNLEYYLKNIFQGVDFEGKNVIDIGSGPGIYGSYAAFMGAKKVVCLEPESDGGKNDSVTKAKRVAKLLNLTQLETMPIRFQDFDSKDEKFDVVILHASINHLDEKSCINLQTSNEAQRIYAEIFKKLYELSSDGAYIIINDVSRYNFFSLIGVKNPFEPTIDWNKHQSPYLWSYFLKKQGFKDEKIRWISPSKLKIAGKIFLENKFASYFINSKFLLTLKK